MPERLRIAVADDELDMREFYEQILPRMGYDVVSVAHNGRDLVEKCRESHPDLVITDIRMPELDGLAALHEICAEAPVPAIVVSAYHDDDFLNRARQEAVLAYLVKPIKATDLEPAIVLARQRFHEFQALQHEADSLRQALEDRKTIERAKGLLMTKGNLTEPEAFRRLQKISNDKNMKMIEVARMIVVAEEALS